jgi:hypothetical protein
MERAWERRQIIGNLANAALPRAQPLWLGYVRSEDEQIRALGSRNFRGIQIVGSETCEHRRRELHKTDLFRSPSRH